MSFVQLHAAAATAAADSAYIEDVRTVKQLLYELRQRTSAVRGLQRFYGNHQCPPQRPQATLGEEQQLQHQQQLQHELEAARRAADGLRKALRQLQQHVVAAASMSEKHERHMYYTEVVGAAGHLLRQLRDAAEGGEGIFQQEHERVLLESHEQDRQEQQLGLQRQQQGQQALRHEDQPPARPSLFPSAESTCVAVNATAAGSVSAAEAATPGEHWWSVTGDPGDQISSRGLPTASAPIELAPAKQTAYWAGPQTGACLGPSQMQHQLMQANKSVPIFIADSKLDALLLQEKHESLAKIHLEIKSIQSLYEQMSFFTEEQGERLDAVGQRLVSTQQETARATRELATAVREERRRKCRRCLFASCMMAVILLFGFAIWWNATQ